MLHKILNSLEHMTENHELLPMERATIQAIPFNADVLYWLVGFYTIPTVFQLCANLVPGPQASSAKPLFAGVTSSLDYGVDSIECGTYAASFIFWTGYKTNGAHIQIHSTVLS